MTKKQIIMSSIFSCIIIAVILCMSLIKVNNCETDSYYLQEENSIDVVTIGPSTVQHGFIPNVAWGEYGYTSYNWGQSLTHIEVMKIKLAELTKSQAPKLVYIDIYPLSYRTYDTYTNRVQWFIDSMPDGESKDYFAEKYEDIYYKSDKIVSLWEKHNEWRDPQAYIDVSKFNGFMINYQNTFVVPQDEILPKKDINDEDVPLLSEYNQNNIIEILDLCSEVNEMYGTKFLFGIMPRFYLYDSNPADGDIINGTATLEKYCVPLIKQAGFDYVNWCDENFLNPETDMNDHDHLNNVGAVRFTRYFSEYIKEHYNIYQEHHSEETVSKYDSLYLDTKSLFDFD